jgi:hypothetical protein
MITHARVEMRLNMIGNSPWLLRGMFPPANKDADRLIETLESFRDSSRQRPPADSLAEPTMAASCLTASVGKAAWAGRRTRARGNASEYDWNFPWLLRGMFPPANKDTDRLIETLESFRESSRQRPPADSLAEPTMAASCLTASVGKAAWAGRHRLVFPLLHVARHAPAPRPEIFE